MAQPRRRPKTGEKRKTNQPLKIDRLPIEVRDAIQFLKNVMGKTWQEIEEISSLPYNPKWKTEGGGFVHWEELPTPVLELFPDLRLPHSNLHRWYDIRVDQVMAETMKRSKQAQQLALSFARADVKGADGAVINAARDVFMGVLAENGSPAAREKTAKDLVNLGFLQQAARANAIKERKIAVDEKTLQMKLDIIKQKAEKLLGTIESADGKKAPQLTREELLEKVREIYGAA